MSKVSYYPGCTLKTKARNLDDTITGSLQALGVDYYELERWNCCGASFSLVDDNLLSLVAPIRNLIRAVQAGTDTIITACSLCYNSLARANLVMRDDEEKRYTINTFLEEEPDYQGDIKVMHLLNFLKEQIGWDVLREKVKVPLSDLKVAPYYGCLLLRPKDIAIDTRSFPQIFEEFVVTLGAEVVQYPSAHDCCGSYQIISNPDLAYENCVRIVDNAAQWGAEAIVSSCPLCEFNLGLKQTTLKTKKPDFVTVPTYYFTQLLAVALGLSPELCHFELNMSGALEFLQERKFVAA